MASREDVPHGVTQHSASRRRSRHFEKKKRAVRARLCSRIASQRVCCNSAQKDTVADAAIREAVARYVSRSSYSLENPARNQDSRPTRASMSPPFGAAVECHGIYPDTRSTKIAGVRMRRAFALDFYSP